MMKGLAKLGQMVSRLNRLCPQMGVRQGHKWALRHPALPVLSVMHRQESCTPGWERAAAPTQRSLVLSDGEPPLMSLGQASPEWLSANDYELEGHTSEYIYPVVDHFSNLAPLHRLPISLNWPKVMFSVAPGKSGKQPKITINGVELKAISNSHRLCSLLSNDRSSALLSVVLWATNRSGVHYRNKE